jgi:serine/threonine protein kinase
MEERYPDCIKNCLDKELKIMKKLKHPNMIAVHDNIKTRSAYIFMGLAINGTIEDYIEYKFKSLVSEYQCKICFYHLLSVLFYFYNNGIAKKI